MVHPAVSSSSTVAATRIGAAVQQLLPPFQLGIDRDDPGLGEGDVLDGAVQEVGLPVPLNAVTGLARQAELAGHGAHQAVDRGAVLGAAGEVDAAQQRPLLQPRRAEDLQQELVGDVAQRGELLREAIDQRCGRRVRLGLHALEHAVVEAVDQQVELLREVGDGAALVLAVIEREGHAPDLLALLLAEIGEELGEAGDEVALGEQHVDREADGELGVQLADARLDRAGMADALVLGQRRRGRRG